MSQYPQSTKKSDEFMRENMWTIACADQYAVCKLCQNKTWCLLYQKNQTYIDSYNSCCHGTSSEWSGETIKLNGLYEVFIRRCTAIVNGAAGNLNPDHGVL